MIIRIAFAAVVAALAATAVVAQSDPVATRRGMMKSVGGANGAITQMLDGKQPFDVAKAKAALMTISDHAGKIGPHFVAGSHTGETAALPSIWENRADFDAKMAKLSTDAKAAADKVTDLDSLKAGIGTVRQNCGGCHNTYRKKAS
jgi:cytochrome c556